MKPYVICHMNASVDGRILGSRWRPAENRMTGLFERLHEQLGGGSWLIGRVTGSEYARAEAYSDHADQAYPREPWFVPRDAAAYGIAVSATMLMTSVLLYMAMREHLRWSLPVSAAVAGCFLIVDSALP